MPGNHKILRAYVMICFFISCLLHNFEILYSGNHEFKFLPGPWYSYYCSLFFEEKNIVKSQFILFYLFVTQTMPWESPKIDSLCYPSLARCHLCITSLKESGKTALIFFVFSSAFVIYLSTYLWPFVTQTMSWKSPNIAIFNPLPLGLKMTPNTNQLN